MSNLRTAYKISAVSFSGSANVMHILEVGVGSGFTAAMAYYTMSGLSFGCYLRYPSLSIITIRLWGHGEYGGIK